MHIEKIPFAKTGKFSTIFLDYLNRNNNLESFYGLFPSPESFGEQMAAKSFDSSNRNVLAEVLEEQYTGITSYDPAVNNINLLRDETTYTITTGHQLNLFSGPLYFIFKIVTALNTCKKLKELHPDKNFVPIYWMASEDHDFEEINHFFLFGKKFEWNCQEKGAVGRFPVQGVDEVLEALPEKIDLFEKAYRGERDLASATRCFVNDLFGAEGLVIIDADHSRLKDLFASVVKDDLLNHHANDRVVKESARLSEKGYKAQVYPRSINFFFLDQGIRERIIKEDGKFQVNNTDTIFTENEILETLDASPEKFSPNVVMRPLYQEVILPNLAYIGGPGEIAYWLQLKGVFEQYGVPFPILMPRNCGMIINKGLSKKITKLDLTVGDLFNSQEELKNGLMKRGNGGDYELKEELAELSALYEAIDQKAGKIDGSLSGMIGAEANKAKKGLENIEKRLKKSEEQKAGVTLNQLDAVLEKLFPGGGLQERKDNFLNFYINNADFIKDLIESFDPFDFRFYVFIDE